MSNDNKNNYTPSLRFPEFKGEWIQKELGKLAEFRRGTTITAKETVNGDVPVIAGGQTPSYFHNVSNREGQTIAISGSGAYAGFVSFWDIPVYLSDSFSVDTKPELNRKYAYYYLKSQQQSLFLMQKGAGVPHVHGSDVGNIIIPLPPTLAEQQKIASCLSEIDNLITAQDQKVDALKEKKKALMQQMFPQQGETTPKLRFPGFEGEWKEKKLCDLADRVNRRNRQLEVQRVLTNSANAGVIDQNEYFDRDIAVRENTENYHVVELEDFVYNPRISASAPVGPISMNKVGRGIMSPLYTVFKFHTGYIPFYELYFQTTIWHPYLKSIANFGARFDRMNITSDGFFNMPLLIPSLYEQQKIAECLSALDDTIKSESDKLDALKDHKKGLMQQLFPQPSK